MNSFHILTWTDRRTAALRDAAQALDDKLTLVEYNRRVAANVKRRTLADPTYLRELRQE